MDTSRVIRAWPRHLYELGQCSRGARAIASQIGLDYSEFVFQGIAVETLRATGNAFAIALAEKAESEVTDGQQ